MRKKALVSRGNRLKTLNIARVKNLPDAHFSLSIPGVKLPFDKNSLHAVERIVEKVDVWISMKVLYTGQPSPVLWRTVRLLPASGFAPQYGLLFSVLLLIPSSFRVSRRPGSHTDSILHILAILVRECLDFISLLLCLLFKFLFALNGNLLNF